MANLQDDTCTCIWLCRSGIVQRGLWNSSFVFIIELENQSKATEKRCRHHFSHYKSMGAFCCHGHQSFDQICLKTLCSLSSPPVILQIRFDQDWPTGLRDIQVRKCKIFVIQGQVTPTWVVWSGPKSNLSELLCLSWLPATLMMIRLKMNELAFSHCKYMGNFLDAQGQLTP